jgi:hypothetical protein
MENASLGSEADTQTRAITSVFRHSKTVHRNNHQSGQLTALGEGKNVSFA